MSNSTRSPIENTEIKRGSETTITIENTPTEKVEWKSVTNIHQVGEKYTEKLEEQNIHTIKQFSKLSESEICNILSISPEFASKLKSTAQEMLN